MKPLKVTGIDHIVLHVKDLSRSKKFYLELLGMEAQWENSWQLFMKCGNQMVAPTPSILTIPTAIASSF